MSHSNNSPPGPGPTDQPLQGRDSRKLVRYDGGTLTTAGRPASRKAPESSKADITPQFILNALRQWWKLATIAGLLLATTAAAVVYLTFQPVYEAQAWIRIRESQPAVLFSNNTSRSNKFVETQRELLRSPKVLRRTISDPDIAAIPDIAGAQSPVNWLQGKLGIHTVGKSELFRISMKLPEAQHAVALVDGVVKAYDEVRREVEAGQRYQWLEFLEEQKDIREQEVKQLREKVRALAKAAGVEPLDSGDTQSSRANPLGNVRSRLAMSQVDQAVLQARISAFEKAPNDEDMTVPATIVARSVAEHPEVVALREELSEKRSYLEQVTNHAVNPEENATVKRVSREITEDEDALKRLQEKLEISVRQELRTQRAADQQQQVSGMREELASLKRLEEALRYRYEEDQEEVKDVASDTVELDFAQMELAEKQEVLNLLNRRIIEYRTEDTAPQRVKVVDTAEENFPTAPLEEYPSKMLALALLIGFGAPFGLAIVWERLVQRISDSESLERQTHLAVLGEIAHLPTRRVTAHGTNSARLTSAFRMFEESIDNVRTGLVLSEDLEGAQVLSVTSASKEEGKTSFASQLAVSMFRASGKPTLLLDGDLRSPDVHRVFDCPQGPGLSDVLAGTCTVDDAVAETDVPGLMILPAGDTRTSPHRLMNNGELKGLINELRERYHYIVIDTPPVLAASESLVLNKMADASVICAMRDLSRCSQVRHACERLAAAGCHTVGGVLNGIPTQRFRYAYGEYATVK